MRVAMKMNGVAYSGVLLWAAASLAAGAALAAPPEAWRSAGVGGGGALYAPSYSPHHPDELYLACDMGGQYHTTDAGVTWQLTPFTRLQTSSRSPQVQFTSDPNILYMIDYTGEKQRPVKSIDGGKTWRPLPNDPTRAEAWYMFADGTQTDRLLLSSYRELFVSHDGGATFAAVFQTKERAGLHLAGVFFDGDFIAIGTNQGLLISADGGATCSRSPAAVPPGEAMAGFAGAKSGDATRFFCVTLGVQDVYGGVGGAEHKNYRGVYVMARGAPGWVRRTEGIAKDARLFFVAAARNHPEVAYLAMHFLDCCLIY